ncbi:MAG: hypothetical protein ACOCRX_00650 [Candidatus Woesearchaeota archaeon]
MSKIKEVRNCIFYWENKDKQTIKILYGDDYQCIVISPSETTKDEKYPIERKIKGDFDHIEYIEERCRHGVIVRWYPKKGEEDIKINKQTI